MIWYCRAMRMPLLLPDAAENVYQAQLLTFVEVTTLRTTARHIVAVGPCLDFGHRWQEQQNTP